MFEINEILDKAVNKETLTQKEKFEILNFKKIDINVIEYLMERLSNLYIEVAGDYVGTLFDLMKDGQLEGWCWQTTESVIVFLNDNDYIERGNLKLDEKNPEYYHSWVCFNYNGIEYVLDPCLNYLCKKGDYYKIFDVDIKGKVSAKAVREELIKQVTAPKKEDNSHACRAFDSFMKSHMGDSYEKYKESKKEEVTVHSIEDVNSPLYRNGVGYKTKIENGIVKKMRVHYYYTGC